MKHMKLDIIALAVLILFLASPQQSLSQEDYKTPHKVNTYTNLKPHKLVKIKDTEFGTKPKNIILLIGDGMGVAQVYAGITANGGKLNLMQMPHTGFNITTSSNNYITDSGAGGTAIASGTKTYNGAIGVNADTVPVKSILEIAESNGLKTGLVSTSSITHATPASFIAHQKDRGYYENIAADFLDTDIDLFIGGGRIHFEKRKDGRNLSHELRTKGYQVEEKLKKIKDVSKPFVVFTSIGHNEKYSERGDILPKSVDLALESLSLSDKGFFLMVEGSQIDWGGHQNDTEFVVNEVLDFDRAIGQALAFAAKDKNTLVIVTADHETGGMLLKGGDYNKKMVKADFGSSGHTGVMVPVFAYGPGAEIFSGIYHNIEIFNKMISLYDF